MPRYIIIGSMLRAIKVLDTVLVICIGLYIVVVQNPVIAANVKQALVFDWLFFTATDNIMFIGKLKGCSHHALLNFNLEPSMLLMERSAERYPYITSVIMEFLRYSVDEYFPSMRDYMAKCVATGMRIMLEKGVIRQDNRVQSNQSSVSHSL